MSPETEEEEKRENEGPADRRPLPAAFWVLWFITACVAGTALVRILAGH